MGLLIFFLSACQAYYDPQASSVTRSYYYFLRAQYEELSHQDDAAIRSMKQASSEVGGPYYLNLETAKMLARKGRLEEARNYVGEAIVQNPGDPEPRLFAGYLASITGQWEDAEANYLEALRLDPQNEEAISFLGAMYAESGRLDEASEAFRRLGAMTPTSYLPDYFLGRVAHRQGDLAEAKRCFQRAVQKKPEFVEGLVELALINEQMGDLKSAEANYRQILRYRPDISMAKARLSRILIKTGKRAEAIALIEELSGMPHSSEEAGLTIGLMFLEEGLYANASEEFNWVLKHNPQSSRARYLYALTLSELGDLERAITNLQKIPPQSEEYVDSMLFLASLLAREGRNIEALEILTEARRNNASSPMLLVATGRIMEELDHLTQSRDLYREGLKLFPDSADIYFSLGAVEDRLGRRDECIDAMRRAVELDPDFSEALNYLAYTWAEENRNLKEALSMAIKANTLRPDNGYYLDTLGWVYFKMGDYEKALMLLERAAVVAGEDPVILEHLGDALVKRGRTTDAWKVYGQAVERGHETPEAINEKMRQILN
jgi:tetratricopeptide (TPR) repeat protein